MVFLYQRGKISYLPNFSSSIFTLILFLTLVINPPSLLVANHDCHQHHKIKHIGRYHCL